MDTFCTCPCQSGTLFGQCCGPLLSGQARAATAEALMRSRYTAFCLKKTGYVLSTWAPETRPDRVDLESDDRVWSGLLIVNTARGGKDDVSGSVEFKASYVLGDDTWLHHEISQFHKLGGDWFYQDHTCPYHGRIAHRGNLLSNAPCSCGSGRRYGKCCRPAR